MHALDPSPAKLPVRLGVDTDGTFTDCVLLEGSQVRILKVCSTPDDAARAILEGARRLVPFQLIEAARASFVAVTESPARLSS